MNRCITGVFAATIVVTSVPVHASPNASATQPSASACSDGSRAGAIISLRDAFEHPIDDGPTLRFLGLLTAMDAAHQGAVVANITKLGVAAAAVPADAEAGCSTDLGYRTIRGLTLIANKWNIDSGDRTFELLTQRLELALASLGNEAALAPFGLHARDLTMASAFSKDCDTGNRDARTVRVREPGYPAFARANRVTGLITLRLTLNDEGLVRAVTLMKSTAGDHPGAQSLVDESVLAAALTTYEPALVKCKPVPGTYVFRADFFGK